MYGVVWLDSFGRYSFVVQCTLLFCIGNFIATMTKVCSYWALGILNVCVIYFNEFAKFQVTASKYNVNKSLQTWHEANNSTDNKINTFQSQISSSPQIHQLLNHNLITSL